MRKGRANERFPGRHPALAVPLLALVFVHETFFVPFQLGIQFFHNQIDRSVQIARLFFAVNGKPVGENGDFANLIDFLRIENDVHVNDVREIFLQFLKSFFYIILNGIRNIDISSNN